jgi:hypothetical protein
MRPSSNRTLGGRWTGRSRNRIDFHAASCNGGCFCVNHRPVGQGCVLLLPRSMYSERNSWPEPARRTRMHRREFLQTTGIRAGCVVLEGAGMALVRADANRRRQSRPACCCGTLLGSPDLPYIRDPQSDVYTLILCPQLSVRGVFCFFCGGHPQGPWQENPTRCTCGSLATWAAEPSAAIQWDQEILECFLLTSRGERAAHWPMYFCPNCGRLAPGAPHSEKLRSGDGRAGSITG